MIDSQKVKSDLDRITNGFADQGPKNAKSSSIGDLRKANELSKVSLNFGGSRSNLSSIVHLEEVSNGHYSIDKQEYRLQRRRGSQEDRSQNQRGSQESRVLKDEPMGGKHRPSMNGYKLHQDSGKELPAALLI